MKAFFALLALSCTVLADVELSRDQAQSIKALDLKELSEKGPKLNGEIVKLRFTRRSNIVSKTSDGGLQGRLSLYKSYDNVGNYQPRYGSVEVVVPAEGVDWFMKVKIDDSRSQQNVYVRLKFEGETLTAHVLGKEIKTDYKGSKIVW